MLGGVYRASQRSLALQATTGLQANLDRLGQLQAGLSSGKRITRPSDDPAGTETAMLVRSQARAAQQASRNAMDGLGWLGTADEALGAVTSSLQRARDLTVQGSSTGSNDASSLAAIAAEVDQIRQGVIDQMNTSYNGRPVFGGTTGGGKAYDPTGAFVGDTNPVSRSVGEGVSVQVNVSGPQAFGSGATGVLGVLAAISADLRSNPAALAADLSSLDAAMKGVTAAQSDVGARFKRVQTMQTAADDLVGSLGTRLSAVEDIDLPRTVVELQLQQNAYQAALGATSKAISLSLADFLR